MRLTCTRPFRGRWHCLRVVLLLCMALAAGPLPGPAPAAAESGVTFSVADSVSAEDAVYVREGTAYAQRYVSEMLSDVSDEALIVNVRNSDDTTSLGSVAFSGGDYIVVFTGSPGWKRLAPFDRVHVVVHEYIHSYQYFVSDGESNMLPAWFIEGMADYLAYDAVSRLGLVRTQDVYDFHAWAVNLTPELPALDKLEEPDDFYDEYGPTYSLAYLAVEELLGNRDPAELDRLLRLVGSGESWDDAFREIFDLDVKRFYRSFEDERESLIAPTDAPEPFDYVAPEKLESRVSIVSTSDPVEVGGQITVLARAEAGAICRTRIRGKETGEAVSGSTFADASGRVFWLLTIPDKVGPGPATVTASCGAERTRVDIEISA